MPQRYPREHLADLAAKSSCLSDFLEKLGVERTPQRRRYMNNRLGRLGIDTSHWNRSPKRWYSDEQLAQACRQSVSYAGALRLLGVPVTGGQHAHLARRIRRAGTDTSHFLGQAHLRGKAGRRKPASEVLVRDPEAEGRTKTPILRRSLLEMGVVERCTDCGSSGEWRGAPLRLVIDHRNGDWRDNRQENLRFLCPNCHAQTATWCRKTTTRPSA